MCYVVWEERVLCTAALLTDIYICVCMYMNVCAVHSELYFLHPSLSFLLTALSNSNHIRKSTTHPLLPSLGGEDRREHTFIPIMYIIYIYVCVCFSLILNQQVRCRPPTIFSFKHIQVIVTFFLAGFIYSHTCRCASFYEICMCFFIII